MEINEIIETLDIFTDYFKCPSQQNCQACMAEGYCNNFDGREKMLEALQFAIQTLQEVADGRRPLLPCRAGDRVYTICAGIICWMPFEFEHLYELGKTVFVTPEAAEKALEAGR